MANGTILPIKKVGTSMMIGDYDGGNYTEFRDDGFQILHGKAIAYIDMYGDVTGKRLTSTTGSVDMDWDNNCLSFQDGGNIASANDRIVGNVQNNHQFVIAEGATLIGVIMHFHWLQKSVATQYQMTMQTRLLKNGESFDSTADWTSTTLSFGANNQVSDEAVGGDVFVFALDSGDDTFNQISLFPILNLDFGLSDTLQYRITRSDDNNGENVLVSFLDTHLPVNAFGSYEPIEKY